MPSTLPNTLCIHPFRYFSNPMRQYMKILTPSIFPVEFNNWPKCWAVVEPHAVSGRLHTHPLCSPASGNTQVLEEYFLTTDPPNQCCLSISSTFSPSFSYSKTTHLKERFKLGIRTSFFWQQTHLVYLSPNKSVFVFLC